MSTIFAKIACSIGKTAIECRFQFRPGPLPLRFAELLNKLAEKECSKKDVEDNAAPRKNAEGLDLSYARKLVTA